MSDMSNFWTVGSWTSSGNLGLTISALSLTRRSAVLASTYCWNSTVMTEAPSMLWEVIFLTPSKEASSSSMGRVMRVSISSGPAPW